VKYAFTIIVALVLLATNAIAQPKPDEIKLGKNIVKVWPVEHASVVMQWGGHTIYVDPAADKELFKGYAAPDIIFITDIHGDHMNAEVLQAVNKKNAIIIAPPAVAEKLPEALKKNIRVLRNGEEQNIAGITVKAIPMYNLPETADARHPKGRGNGYVLSMGGKSIYISGDTEDIPEMRSLKNIDVAFVCMNLPYTMDIKQAASAVLEFKPKIVFPYHHRGQDIAAFKKLVNDKDRNIDVRLRNWYPKGE
jgi:L-ascorbate metabolism protein UlaG (beta-lactamase superfamily)